MFALKAATQSGVGPNTGRYSRLTPMQYLDSADIEALMGAGAQRSRAKIPKQVQCFSLYVICYLCRTLGIAYSLFPSCTSPHSHISTPAHPAHPAQVDAEWLANRKYGGPSKEEMAALALPDPLVSLQLHHSLQPSMVGDRMQHRLPARDGATATGVTGTGVTGVKEYLFNSDFGLSYTTDSNLTPAYHCAVNMDQVFGKFDCSPSTLAEKTMREEFDRELVLELTSSM
jgi:hypothetical protein